MESSPEQRNRKREAPAQRLDQAYDSADAPVNSIDASAADVCAGAAGAAGFEAKRAQEKQTLALMVGIYCKGKHHTNRAPEGPGPHGAGICPRCQELVDYCFDRIEHCPHMETKTFCSACETHCYRRDMRARVREAMAYAGPRMLFYDPAGAVRHLRHGQPHAKRS